jgi:hypothetical protein
MDVIKGLDAIANELDAGDEVINGYTNGERHAELL